LIVPVMKIAVKKGIRVVRIGSARPGTTDSIAKP
jgi:hypothetical protein